MPTTNPATEPTASSDASPIRLFVGLKIEEAIAQELARIAYGLESPEVRAVAADDIHLTLVPPWQERSTSDAIEKLRQVAAKFSPFALIIQHASYGPDRRSPRLLWVDCAAGDELTALRDTLLAAYNQSDEKPFRPHLTVARIRGNGRRVAREHPVDQPLAFRQRVETIELFQSPAPGAGGRGYRVLASVRLGQASEKLGIGLQAGP
jgi:RNA 2',3'-cyclic 3'-phosphodiesterase